ncbi:hypothetical protein ACHAWT_001355 [Skeletonema menzelii]
MVPFVFQYRTNTRIRALNIALIAVSMVSYFFWDINYQLMTIIQTKQLYSQSVLASSNAFIRVFYNVYADPTGGDIALNRARDYVREQMGLIQPSLHQVFIRSIGAQFKVENATHVQHDDQGDEMGTLKLLWDYCQKTEDLVVYIHNKGSLHPSKENDSLRQWITRAALSKECSNMPRKCNVCSWRFSPFPHPHNSGNMWAAKCEYVKKLIDPLLFETRMSQLYPTIVNTWKGWMVGVGRHAAEHWVHSHPSVQPCDVSTSDFVWGYDNLPEDDSFELQTFPRTDYNFKVLEREEEYREHPYAHSLDDRLKEYDFLYNETLPASWYGYEFYFNRSLALHFEYPFSKWLKII